MLEVLTSKSSSEDEWSNMHKSFSKVTNT
jgi:hypothetical protein